MKAEIVTGLQPKVVQRTLLNAAVVYDAGAKYEAGATVTGADALWQSEHDDNTGNPLPTPPNSDAHWKFLASQKVPATGGTASNALIRTTSRMATPAPGSIAASNTFTPVALNTAGFDQIAHLSYDSDTKRLKNTATVARQFWVAPYCYWATAASAGRPGSVQLLQRTAAGAAGYAPTDTATLVNTASGQTFCQLETPVLLGPDETLEVGIAHQNASGIGAATALTCTLAGVFIVELEVEALKGDEGKAGDSARVLAETRYGAGEPGSSAIPSGGSATHAFNPSTRYFEVIAVGGGGAAGSHTSAAGSGGAGGGGGAAAYSKRIPVTTATVDVFWGAGGAPVAGQQGGSGGTSAVVSGSTTLVSAGGGGGGQVLAGGSTAGSVAGPAGGSQAASPGTQTLYVLAGSRGDGCTRFNASILLPGAGGGSALSGGTSANVPIGGSAGGVRGTHPGGGGAGGGSNIGAAALGGAGGAGMVIIREYA